jgi:nucleotide-binding universal stress UspA family protein
MDSEKKDSNELPLVSSVLLPTDFSPASEEAFAHALAIANIRQTELTILHVGSEQDAEKARMRFPRVRETLERWGLLQPSSPGAAVLDELNIKVKKVTLHGTDPGLETLRYLKDHPVDLIVLATEGRAGLPRWIEPSIAETLARSSRTMSLFVPHGAKRAPVSMAGGILSVRNILVPVDHQPQPLAALEFARRAAEQVGDGIVTITLLHVGDDHFPAQRLENGPKWSWRVKTCAGDAVTQIIKAANEVQAELIVMTTTGHNGVLDVLRGSTTEQVLRRSPCPLLAVPDRYSAYTT